MGIEQVLGYLNEENRLAIQQRQAMASDYERKIQQQQDVIKVLAEQLSSARRVQYN